MSSFIRNWGSSYRETCMRRTSEITLLYVTLIKLIGLLMLLIMMIYEI